MVKLNVIGEFPVGGNSVPQPPETFDTYGVLRKTGLFGDSEPTSGDDTDVCEIILIIGTIQGGNEPNVILEIVLFLGLYNLVGKVFAGGVILDSEGGITGQHELLDGFDVGIHDFPQGKV